MRKKISLVAAMVVAFLSISITTRAQTAQSKWVQFNPVTALTSASFANPPAADRPWVRMNMSATADPTELKVEIQQLHEKGISGVEVGQGAFPNNDQVVALLTAANQFGMKISLSRGPTQNPAGYSIDEDNARKTLFVGKAIVAAGATFQRTFAASRRNTGKPQRFRSGAGPHHKRSEPL
jgi:hypothetical protein